MTEFVGRWHIRAFPIHGLNHYVFKRGYCGDGQTRPDRLVLEYSAARMILIGWRLDLLAERFRRGGVERVCVTHPPRFQTEEPHVTAMWIKEH
jgi:hypothetical protein